MNRKSLRHTLLQSVGSAAVALHIIDTPGDPTIRLAKARVALVNGFNGRPVATLQLCPLGRHREWWAEGTELPCPWCRIDALKADLAAAAPRLSLASNPQTGEAS